MAELLPALSARRARRAFDPRDVSPDVQALLWRSVSVAPSHGNSQSVRLMVAESAAVRSAIVAALSDGNGSWAPAAPLLVALGALPTHERGDAYGAERSLWSFHAGIAAGNLMTQATALGLVAHPMAGFDEAAVRSAFSAPEALRLLAVFAIGYPGQAAELPEDLQRRELREQRRQPLERLIAVDAWGPEHELTARESSPPTAGDGKLRR